MAVTDKPLSAEADSFSLPDPDRGGREMGCRCCEHLDINTIDKGATCKFGLVPETCGRFELADCYKAMVEEEGRLGCEYGTYCDGEDRVFYPEGALKERVDDYSHHTRGNNRKP